MLALLGGLGAASLFALATLCSSRSSRLIPPASVLAGVMITGLVVLLPALAVSETPRDLSAADATWLLLAGAGNVGGLLLAYSALRVGKVAIVAPILSTQGALAAVTSILTGERLGVVTAWLLIIIAVGVAVAAVAPDPAPVAAGAGLRPVVLACAAALVFGASLYATARASVELPVAWVLLPARLIGVLVIAAPLLVRGRLRVTRAALPFVVTGGVCEVLGFGAFALGSRYGVAVTAVLASQFAGLAAVAAYLLFSERLTRVQLSGISLIALGVAVLSAVRA